MTHSNLAYFFQVELRCVRSNSISIMFAARILAVFCLLASASAFNFGGKPKASKAISKVKIRAFRGKMEWMRVATRDDG